MSTQPFERQVAAALRRQPGLFVFHPSDAGAAKLRVPGDFIWGCARGWGVLEVKACDAISLPAARWEPHQRRTAIEVEAADGRYILLVRFGRAGLIFWFPAATLRSATFVSPGMGRRLQSLDDLVPLLLS